MGDLFVARGGGELVEGGLQPGQGGVGIPGVAERQVLEEAAGISSLPGRPASRSTASRSLADKLARPSSAYLIGFQVEAAIA